MSPHLKACGYCSNCRTGRSSLCFFPSMVGGMKSVSSMSALDYTTTLYKGVVAGPYQSCASTHKPLVIPAGDKTITLYGGKMTEPVKKDCDIYVGLDRHSTSPIHSYPWQADRKVVFTFPIIDHSVPDDAAEFKNLIAWLKEQALSGKCIHVGCIGGHGRTGMVLAALVKEIGGIEDAIAFTRANYCKKAVEAKSQSEFLTKHFGIKGAIGSKEGSKGKSKRANEDDFFKRGEGLRDDAPYEEWVKRKDGKASRAERFNRRYVSNDIAIPIRPAKLGGNIWGINEW